MAKMKKALKPANKTLDNFNTKIRDERLETILNSIADGVFTVDKNWKITFFNRAAEEITGITSEEAVGSLCHTIFRANICESGCALRETLKTRKQIINKEIRIICPDGTKKPISISTAVLYDMKNQVLGGVETFRDLSEVHMLRQNLIDRNTFTEIVSRNHEMRKIFSILPDVALSDATVLITGSSGTGKELIARSIHKLSNRKDHPLITVNCGAIPDTLLESELFGYKAGAFTDAKKDKLGKFALAKGGTIFLDEIGDVTPALQTRLLRVIQEKEYEPLGDIKTYKTKARIVAATNKDLEYLIKNNSFREDLYYRLSVVEFKLPALKDRKEDIPLLSDYFIKNLRELKKKQITVLSDEALALLLTYDFPGNIRELENIIEYAFILCPEGVILPQHLPSKLINSQKVLNAINKQRANLTEIEFKAIEQTLIRNKYHRLNTAKELGIGKVTLWRKIKKHKIKIPKK